MMTDGDDGDDSLDGCCFFQNIRNTCLFKGPNIDRIIEYKTCIIL